MTNSINRPGKSLLFADLSHNPKRSAHKVPQEANQREDDLLLRCENSKIINGT